MRLYYSALFGATLKLSGILKYASIKRDAPSMGLRCLSRYMRPLAANYTPSVGFLPDFSSSFNIKTRHIPRWDFLFSACNLFFFSLPNDFMAKRKVYSSSHFPSLLYFSKLSWANTTSGLYKIRDPAIVRFLKNNIFCCSLLSQCLKGRKLSCVHNCPNTEPREPQMLLTRVAS